MEILSPGVYTTERDFSDYVAGVSTTILALVGTASRGPINTPTRLTSPEAFLSTFGVPDANSYGPLAALAYLRRGNSLWYNRVALLYEPERASFDGMLPPNSDGKYYAIEVFDSTLNIGDYVRISQSGKATSQNLQIADIDGSEVYFSTPMLDSYNGGSVRIDAAASTAAGNAEAVAVSRHHGSVFPVLRFKARHPGSFSNFGGGKGIEIVIEDGGQFANVDVNGDPIASDGIPLQGVMPSAPSVDTYFDLVSLTSADGVRVGQTRGVNYASSVAKISAVADSSERLALTVNSSAGFTIDGAVEISGTSAYDGEWLIADIPNSTSIILANFSGVITTGAEVGFIEAINGRKFSVVHRCIAVSSSSSTWSPVGVLTKRVRVLFEGRQVEVFDNLIAYDSASANFWETVVGTEASPKSAFITCSYFGGDGEQPINSFERVKHPNNPRYYMGAQLAVRLTDSASAGQQLFGNSKGYNGDNPAASDYIGTISQVDGSYTGLQFFRQKELYDINLIAIPGISTANVINELIALLEYRKDCFGVIDSPFGLSKQQVIDWHNGTGPYTGLHSAFVTNRAALYHGWVRIYDPYTKRDLWQPPSAFVPGIIADTDRKARVWQAPAGLVYGKVPNATAVEVVYNEEDRNACYGPGNGNAINAIVNFSKDGVTVYGQRTLQRHPSALDRINVRRMMLDLIKIVAAATRRLNFEQNGPVLWEDFVSLVEPAFRTRKQQGALEWYQVICDDTVNTPERRNTNQSYAKLLVIPVKASEAFELEFTLLPSGVNVNEFIARDVGGSTVQA